MIENLDPLPLLETEVKTKADERSVIAKNTITVTAHDRPELLSRTLDALSENNTDGWELFVSIEPTALTDNMVSIVKERFPDANILLPETKLGVRENPFQLL